MIALSQGDRAAFRPVFSALWPLLRRFSLRALGDAALAEDAAQAALTKLFFTATEFDPARDAVAWALGYASYEVLSLRKRKWRRERFDLPLLAAQLAGGGTPEDLTIERDLRTAAAEALGVLRQKDIETLEAVLEGQRPRGSETARAAFRKRVQRAIERVRLAWRNKHGTD
jgi:DNA-directed RNA polymerase specialized sigma24 family protein